MTLQPRLDAEVLDALLAPYDSTSAPGFAVGVAIGGQPVYRRAVGVASVDLPVPLSPTMRMRIGSTTKHVCVLALMLLAEEGLLALEDSPRRIMPELPDWAEAITIRQLMAHTSGMRDSLDLLLLAMPCAAPVPADAQVAMLSALDSVNFAPGANWAYNNAGYALLSRLAEKVSGMPLADLMATRIFRPLGMHDTLLHPDDQDCLPNHAGLHVPDGRGGWRRGGMGVPVAGEGGIVSTVDDMLRWMRHMDVPIVGSAQSWTAMRTPLTSHGYGLGLMMDRHRGLDTLHHAGGLVGGACQMLKVIEPGLDLVVLTNGRGALDLYRLVDAIIDACLPGLPPREEAPSGPLLTGTFHSRSTGRVITLAEHEGQPVAVVGGMALPARWGEDGALGVEIMPTDLRLTPLDDGATLMAREFGQEDRLELVSAPEADMADGHYRCAQAGLTLNIAGQDMVIAGSWGHLDYALRPLGPGLWEGLAQSPLPIWLTLERDGDGLLLSTGRTSRLSFARAA